MQDGDPVGSLCDGLEKQRSPGIDGVTFEAIQESGEQNFLEEPRDELVSETYRPAPNRKKEIPKGGGKVRTLGIPTIRDRVVQGVLELILEPKSISEVKLEWIKLLKYQQRRGMCRIL